MMFRVHFNDGGKGDVEAATPAAAVKAAKARHDAAVAKVKRVKAA